MHLWGPPSSGIPTLPINADLLRASRLNDAKFIRHDDCLESVAQAQFGQEMRNALLTNDGTLRDELIASKLIDTQLMPEFIAYAIDTNSSVARRALIAMARRR